MARVSRSRVTAPALVLVAAAVLAAAIFIFDTVTPYGMAIAVPYVIVVFIAGSFLPPRGILVTAAACAALTVLSYVLQHGDVNPADSLGRALMSLSAIGVTTLLVLRNHSAQAMRRDQERSRRPCLTRAAENHFPDAARTDHGRRPSRQALGGRTRPHRPQRRADRRGESLVLATGRARGRGDDPRNRQRHHGAKAR